MHSSVAEIEWWGCKGRPLSSVCITYMRALLRTRVSGGEGFSHRGTHVAHSPIEYPVDVEVKVEQQLFAAAPRDGDYSALVIGHSCIGRRPANTASLHFGGARCRVWMLTGRTRGRPCCLADRPTDCLLERSESQTTNLYGARSSAESAASRGGMHHTRVLCRCTRRWQYIGCPVTGRSDTVLKTFALLLKK